MTLSLFPLLARVGPGSAPFSGIDVGDGLGEAAMVSGGGLNIVLAFAVGIVCGFPDSLSALRSSLYSRAGLAHPHLTTSKPACYNRNDGTFLRHSVPRCSLFSLRSCLTIGFHDVLRNILVNRTLGSGIIEID